MFTPIDLKSWPRAQIFGYFSSMAPTGYSLTVRLDVTKMYNAVKAAGYHFFPAYIWLLTRTLNQWTEFKCAVKDGKVGYYDTLTPLYASFHDDDHTFSLMWTTYCDDFSEFHRRYMKNKEEFGDVHGVLSQPFLPPENAYTVSCLPWVEFEHFAVHSYDNKPYFFPSIEAGKFEVRDGRRIMPLSITCHHATTDGYHVAEFLKVLRADMDSFGELIG